jgi:hypothetical protein
MAANKTEITSFEPRSGSRTGPDVCLVMPVEYGGHETICCSGGCHLASFLVCTRCIPAILSRYLPMVPAGRLQYCHLVCIDLYVC